MKKAAVTKHFSNADKGGGQSMVLACSTEPWRRSSFCDVFGVGGGKWKGHQLQWLVIGRRLHACHGYDQAVSVPVLEDIEVAFVGGIERGLSGSE
ncbi:hypothetical protein [Luteolibacter rhizosphaerae]|uniref:hypothetical protein n=1 Tax=Luteolibacter rhizosphaerae TaxID=2989719 RepID=UPI002222B5F4|nr:hypothetical protein [Luteolibacter rhizosphaerae]